jgi:hypothetical protein
MVGIGRNLFACQVNIQELYLYVLSAINLQFTNEWKCRNPISSFHW